MQEIYMVTVCYHNYCTPEVEAAFSTREQAEALAEALRAQDYDPEWVDINVSVEECLLDPDWVKGFYVIVKMDRTGALVKEPERYITLEGLPFQGIVGFDETPGGLLHLSHFAATGDVDVAVQQTNDIREKAINLGYWPDESLPSHDFESLLDAGQRLGAHLAVKSTELFSPTEGRTPTIGSVII